VAIWTTVARTIAAARQRPYEISGLGPMMGGRVSMAYTVTDGRTPYFVKLQDDSRGGARAYDWEARSLRAIAAAGVRTPEVIARGRHGSRAFIVLESIPVAPPPSPAAIAQALHRLHRTTGPAYGADAAGWVGVEPIDNTPAGSWADFWCQRRLLPRLSGRGAAPPWDPWRARIDPLLPVIRAGLSGYRPPPSLLHGDLQSPNWMGGPDGSVVFIDPAVWFGDPEVDLAALGVGPPAAREALEAYVALDPRPEGFAWRIAVYRLWYLLLCHPPEIGALLDETIECVAGGAPG
jgi:fructosamine-3-kinase